MFELFSIYYLQAAFNDCSIRELDDSTKLSEKKNWGFGSKGISLSTFPVDRKHGGFTEKNPLVANLALVSYVMRGNEIHLYTQPAPVSYIK